VTTKLVANPLKAQDITSLWVIGLVVSKTPKTSDFSNQTPKRGVLKPL
jgi:hypothetical protein